MKLKMCTTGKTFDKICLKTIRDTFFQHVVCNQRRDGMRYKERGRNPFFGGKWHPTEWWGSKFWAWVRGLSWSPIKKHPEECAWSKYCNNFGKSKRVCIFFQSNKFTACKVRDEKRVAKSLMVFNLRKIIHLFKN